MTNPIVELLGDEVVKNDKSTVKTESFSGEGKVVMLYFSAHWCPPCRGFTPGLTEFYNKFHADKNFEIVFLSSDRDEESFNEYFAEMPWLSVPFSDRARKETLGKKYEVRGIPTLVVLDGNTGEVITKDGRNKVMSDDNCVDFPWR